MLDLVIRNGQVVNAGSIAIADVGIANGSVVQIGGEMQAARAIGRRDAWIHAQQPVQRQPQSARLLARQPLEDV